MPSARGMMRSAGVDKRQPSRAVSGGIMPRSTDIYFSSMPGDVSSDTLQACQPVTAGAVASLMQDKAAGAISEHASPAARYRSIGHGLLVTGVTLLLFGFAVVMTETPDVVMGHGITAAGVALALAGIAALVKFAWEQHREEGDGEDGAI